MTHLTRIAPVVVLAAALAAGACKPVPESATGNTQAQFALPALPATLPLEAGPARDIPPAPSASDLPDAPPLARARIADPREAYGYADAAYGYDAALGDAPPDYAFDYDGTDPWAWQGSDDSLLVAEPVEDGYRSYYYRPGAAEPYFIRDPWYSYGFADGLLAVVYAADGGVVSYADYGPRLGYASRYYARGRRLWSASRGSRRPVVAANWARRHPVLLAARERWGAGRAHQPDWRRFAEAGGARQAGYWQAEHIRREADARRFADWRQAGFRTAPPPRAIPAKWQRAEWARDPRRYRPAAEAPRDLQPQREARTDARVTPQLDLAERQARREEAREQRRPQRVAERQEREAARRPERKEAQPPRRIERREVERLERRQARAERPADQPHAAERARDHADPGQRQAERAERQQAQAARQGAIQAQREQQQAARAQAVQAEREQAQAQAQRQQAAQAQRQQMQQQRRQAAQAQHQQAQPQQAQPQPARQQRQEQRQQQRQERREARGSGPH